ncbi:MAG: cell envelope biogenesis protein OmpA, partial [Bacteroidales bacterium]|nr:cell envelope biogenesis protein OmpA [Bacteroidales bacterium]
DIRQSHFTGANINMVTRSGDNRFQGSVYSFIRPKSLTGNLVDDNVVANANNRHSQLYGARFGGPIIKNKLFFFVSGEYEVNTLPGNEWMPSADGVSDVAHKISRTSVSDLTTMKDFLWQQYQYDAGSFQNDQSLKSDNYKILARIDWNIHKKHKFSIRYNEVHSESDQLVNMLSSPIGNLPDTRYGASSIAFSNTNYRFADVIRSITAELNSNFGTKISNKLLVNYSHIRSQRKSNSDLFPFVDIWKDNKPYMSFGYEPFSYGTDLTNNIFEVTDNVSYYVGKHTLLAGVSFNYMSYLNNYRMFGLGYYRFDDPDDFYQGNDPSVFALTYGFQEEQPMFRLDFGMGSLYLQDEWRFNDRFMLTYGIRLELPFYFNQLKDNPSIDSLKFADEYQMNIGAWPQTKLSVSPRVGFNWKMPTEKINMTMRGGSGIFSGLLPFVWFNEQPSLSGVIQNTVIKTDGQIPFVSDYHSLLSAYPTIFPSQAEGVVPSTFVEVDKNFKMPMVWRNNLAFEWKLPADFVLTVEGLFSKDLQAVVQQNVNEKQPQQSFSGSDQRDSWWNDEGIADNKINQNVKYAMIVTNAPQGYQYSITTQLEKKLSYNISGAVSYTYSVAKNLGDNYGTSAKSRFLNNVSVNSLNQPSLSYSGYSVPHHIVGSVTYRIEDVKNLAFSVSLVYKGSAQGRYSFIYSNDMNGDGNVSDLIYIPQNASDISFADADEMSADEQQKAFWNFVVSNKYLNQHRGDYAERNGFIGPWVHRFDIRFLQDIFSDFGTQRRYTLQLSLDVLNVGNLLNSRWGCYQIHGFGNESNSNISLLKFKGTNSNNEPIYQLNADNINDFQENAQWFKNISTTSTWGCLLGLRLLF